MISQPLPVSAASFKANKIPSLSENTFLRYCSFAILYVAQGIPEGMTYYGIPAWLAMNGKTPGEIGSYVAVIGIPWSFKILVAPLMDRFTFLAMGRRRPWVLVGQLGLMASFIAMAFVPDPLKNLPLLMAAGFMISFFGAFQDVATDGMAIDIVPISQQARANGLMWGSKTVGISVSMVIGNWIIHHYGFSFAIFFLSFGVCLIMMVPLLMRERPGEKFLPWTKGSASPGASKMQLESWSEIAKSLVKVFFLPTSLLLGIAFFIIQMAFGLMDTVFPVFTIQEIGWTDQQYSHVFSITNIIAGFLGMFAGGALADLFGKKRMISVYLGLFIIISVSMTLLKQHWSSPILINAYIGIYYVLYVFLSVAAFATAMQLCWKRVAATQFTLYMAISNLGRASGAGLLGPMRKYLEWQYILLSLAGFAIVTLFIIQLLRPNKHISRVTILEDRQTELDKAV
jgi:PAT family beta-lactamase induction signal transducer AmpG